MPLIMENGNREMQLKAIKLQAFIHMKMASMNLESGSPLNDSSPDQEESKLMEESFSSKQMEHAD